MNWRDGDGFLGAGRRHGFGDVWGFEECECLMGQGKAPWGLPVSAGLWEEKIARM